jgi:superfamily II DNA or RNA helicase
MASSSVVPSPSPPSTIMNTHGYGILKSALEPKELTQIKRDLLVRPFVPPSAPMKPEPFPVYLESPQRIYVPRMWGLQEFGEPEVYALTQGIDCSENLKFEGGLRERQITILKPWLTVVKSPKPEGKILTVPCGYGKTVMSLWCASQVGRKTLVVVHKEFLMNQFREEIGRFLPKARIGRIQGDCCDTEDKDIVLGMLQSIVQKKYPTKLWEEFGMVIFDECHHLAAEVFSRALGTLGSWRMLGLSATPKRKDNLSKVFHWHIGEFMACIQERQKETVHIWMLKHKPARGDTEYLIEPKTVTDCVSLPLLINRVCERPDRTELIVILTKQLVKEGRRILILSDRKQQLSDLEGRFLSSSSLSSSSSSDDKMIVSIAEKMKEEIKPKTPRKRKTKAKDERDAEPEEMKEKTLEIYPPTPDIPLINPPTPDIPPDEWLLGYYVGGMKERELELSSSCHIILGTYAMASEGMNIKALDTLILASPKSDIVQSVGRILRTRPEDRTRVPLVIDIIDPHESLMRQSQRRIQYYRKCEYTLENCQWNSTTKLFEVPKPSSTTSGTASATSNPRTNTSGCLIDDD